MVPRGMKDTQAEFVTKHTNSTPSMSNTLNFEMDGDILHLRDLYLPSKWEEKLIIRFNNSTNIFS